MRVACTGRRAHGCPTSVSVTTRIRPFYSVIDLQSALIPIWCRADAKPRTYAKRYSDNANAECAQGGPTGRPSADHISSRASPTRRRSGHSCGRLPTGAKLSCCRHERMRSYRPWLRWDLQTLLTKCWYWSRVEAWPTGAATGTGRPWGRAQPAGPSSSMCSFRRSAESGPEWRVCPRPYSLRTTPGGGCTDGQKARTDRNRSRGDG